MNTSVVEQTPLILKYAPQVRKEDSGGDAAYADRRRMRRTNSVVSLS